MVGPPDLQEPAAVVLLSSMTQVANRLNSIAEYEFSKLSIPPSIFKVRKLRMAGVPQAT